MSRRALFALLASAALSQPGIARADASWVKDCGGTDVELLDLHEATTLRGIAIPRDPHATLDSELAQTLDRLATRDPKRAAIVRRRIAGLIASDPFVHHVELTEDTPNKDLLAHPVPIPRGCQRAIVARRYSVRFPGDKAYAVQREIWERLPPLDQALILVREAVSDDFDADTSAPLRYFASTLAQPKAWPTQQSYFQMWSTFGLTPIYELEGAKIVIDSQLAFHSNGQLKTARIREASGVTLPEASAIEPKQADAIQDSVFEWDEQGHLLRGAFQQDLRVRAGTGESKISGLKGVEFYPSGSLKHATLLQSVSLTFRSCAVMAPAGDYTFHEDGTVSTLSMVGYRRTTLSLCVVGAPDTKGSKEPGPDEVVVFSTGVNTDWPRTFKFHPNGQVMRGYLAGRTSLRVGDRRLSFSPNALVTFYADGKVARGQLAEDAPVELVSADTRVPVVVAANAVVELDAQGSLIRIVSTDNPRKD